MLRRDAIKNALLGLVSTSVADSNAATPATPIEEAATTTTSGLKALPEALQLKLVRKEAAGLWNDIQLSMRELARKPDIANIRAGGVSGLIAHNHHNDCATPNEDKFHEWEQSQKHWLGVLNNQVETYDTLVLYGAEELTTTGARPFNRDVLDAAHWALPSEVISEHLAYATAKDRLHQICVKQNKTWDALVNQPVTQSPELQGTQFQFSELSHVARNATNDVLTNNGFWPYGEDNLSAEQMNEVAALLDSQWKNAFAAQLTKHLVNQVAQQQARLAMQDRITKGLAIEATAPSAAAQQAIALQVNTSLDKIASGINMTVAIANTTDATARAAISIAEHVAAALPGPDAPQPLAIADDPQGTLSTPESFKSQRLLTHEQRREYARDQENER